MMRLLKPVRIGDTSRIIRMCAQWIREDLGLHVVEYRIGNAFTGSIDILAVDADRVYFLTVNTGRLGDALLGALTGYRWFLENREFLDRVYHSDEVNLFGQPVLVLLSPDFPPEIHSILSNGLGIEFRLFRYFLTGSEEAPDLYVDEVLPNGAAAQEESTRFDGLVRELGIERAGLDADEVRDFLAAVGGD